MEYRSYYGSYLSFCRRQLPCHCDQCQWLHRHSYQHSHRRQHADCYCYQRYRLCRHGSHAHRYRWRHVPVEHRRYYSGHLCHYSRKLRSDSDQCGRLYRYCIWHAEHLCPAGSHSYIQYSCLYRQYDQSHSYRHR